MSFANLTEDRDSFVPHGFGALVGDFSGGYFGMELWLPVSCAVAIGPDVGGARVLVCGFANEWT